MKEKLLISSCLLGANVKYNGLNNKIDDASLEALKEKYELYTVCPESMGGLTIPRNPSEIKGEYVYSSLGIDVTNYFINGANISLKVALDNNIKKALLKESSPSCGSSLVYDGTFTGKKVNGQGITTKLLRENGIEVYSENDINILINKK